MRPNEGEKSPQVAADDESKSSVLSLKSNAAGVNSVPAGGFDSGEHAQKSVEATQCPTCGLTVNPGTQVCPIDGTPLSDTPAPGLSGQYQFIDVLGQGGMAIVHRARHIMLGHEVAIKLLNPSAGYNATTMRRFRQEAAAAKRVEHPNVIRIYDFGVTQAGQPYMIMDCLEGETLQDRIKKGTVPVAQAVPLFKQICLALQHLHANNVLHRDLKPSNVFLTVGAAATVDAPLVKLVDFGIAKVVDPDSTGSNKLTATGDVFGTPDYMSPEQCMGAMVTAMSDIYSLGCLMYETVSGKPPFEGDNPLSVMHQHLNDVAPRLPGSNIDVSLREFNEIVEKCLEKDVALRYQSASELLADLNKFESGNFRRLPYQQKAKRFVRKHPRIAIAALVIAIITCTLSATFAYQSTQLSGMDLVVANTYQKWRNSPQLNELAGTPITDASIPYIARLTDLKQLDLSKTNIDDDGLKQLVALKKLERLNLTKTRVSASGIRYLAQLPHLVQLDLSNNKLDAAALRETAMIPSLTMLYLENVSFSAESMQALPTNLTYLNLSGDKLTNDSIAGISRLSNLTQLEVCDNDKLTDDCLPSIAKLNNLYYLRLSGTGITGPGLASLRRLSNLTALYADHLSLNTLEPLSQLNSVTSLDLSSDRLTDQSLKPLGAMKNLQRVNLSYNKISPSGLANLSSLTNLRSLYVGVTTIVEPPDFDLSNEAVKNLNALPKFQKLVVDGLSSGSAQRFTLRTRFSIDNLESR